MEKMIEVKNVTMRFNLDVNKVSSIKEFVIRFLSRKLQYDSFTALNDISFEVNKGDVVGIVGSNGSGKSTLLKIISGIMKPTSGSISVKGNIVPMLELGSGFDFELTGAENIFLNGAILGYSKEFIKNKYSEIVEFSELTEFINQPLKNYSSGMIMRLAFSIATVVDPEILIVDEILSVGDAYFQEKSYNRMRELMSKGTTVFLVSHNINQVREICNKVLWINRGVQQMYGNTDDVCDKYIESLELHEKD